MKLVFLSNYFNHHQRPLCEALYRLTDGSFRFIETQKMGEERRKLGYIDEVRPGFVLQGLTPEERASVQNTVDDAEILVAGMVPEEMLRNRIRDGKLILRYSERPLKTGNEWWKYPVRYFRWHSFSPAGKPIHMLCASAYTAWDYAKFGLFRNRCYKFGYFPKQIDYSMDDLFGAKEGEPVRILWTGRFIDWKHPEAVLEAAKLLRDCGIPFEIGMIGSGGMKEAIEKTVSDERLEDLVKIYPSMTTWEVREHMKRASVFLLTSDFQEGWGAALNEAMNAGCAVVASHAAGAAPFLIRNGENGILFESGRWDRMTEAVRELLLDPALRRRIGREAYRTVTCEWNAEIAAERLLRLAGAIRDGKDTPFAEGPCSRAEIIKNNWFDGAQT